MAPEQNNYYNEKRKPFAKTLRNDSTKAEIRLWCELLSKSKLGFPFLRQRPVHKYIADFMGKELKLIIKVDGYSRYFKTEEDMERNKKLTDLGYTVLRFTNEEVMKNLPNVQRTLEIWMAERQR